MNTTTSSANSTEGIATHLRHMVDEADQFLKLIGFLAARR